MMYHKYLKYKAKYEKICRTGTGYEHIRAGAHAVAEKPSMDELIEELGELKFHIKEVEVDDDGEVDQLSYMIGSLAVSRHNFVQVFLPADSFQQKLQSSISYTSQNGCRLVVNYTGKQQHQFQLLDCQSDPAFAVVRGLQKRNP